MSIRQIEFSLPSHGRGFHLVTDEIVAQLPPLPAVGLLHLFIKHTPPPSASTRMPTPTYKPTWKPSSTGW